MKRMEDGGVECEYKMSYTELLKKFHKDVSNLRANCKHGDISDWIVEYWAITHPTGWQVKECNFCYKIVVRKTRCKECNKEIIEDVDVIKEVGGCWYCEKCAPDAEINLKKKMQNCI